MSNGEPLSGGSARGQTLHNRRRLPRLTVSHVLNARTASFMRAALLFSCLGTACEGVAAAIPLAFPEFSAHFAKLIHIPAILINLLGLPSAILSLISTTVLWYGRCRRSTNGVHMVREPRGACFQFALLGRVRQSPVMLRLFLEFSL